MKIINAAVELECIVTVSPIQPDGKKKRSCGEERRKKTRVTNVTPVWPDGKKKGRRGEEKKKRRRDVM